MPIHECAHGYMAYRLGDDTARNQGRLTLNPFAHLDLVGSVLLILAGFGWAKPVQVDPRNFKNPKWGMAITSLAGPVSNILLAFVLMVIFKLLGGAMPLFRNSDIVSVIYLFIWVMITTNLYLAVFNLLPIPPLDGSKIFGAILPSRYYFAVMRYERYIIAVVFFLIMFTNILSTPLGWMADRMLGLLDFLTRPLGPLPEFLG